VYSARTAANPIFGTSRTLRARRDGFQFIPTHPQPSPLPGFRVVADAALLACALEGLPVAQDSRAV
jgi:hypothetical protein